MYTCHLLVARKSLVDAVGGFRPGYEGSQDYDLMLRLIERTSAIEHIPRVLYHWRKSPASAAGAGLAKPWAIDAGRRALADYLRRNGLQGEVLDGATPGRYRVRRIVPGRPSVTAIVGAFVPLAPVPGIQLPGREPADEGRGRIEEIVVIAPGGNAGARGSTPASARVRTVVVPPGPGRIGAINDLVRETQGEHLFFIDAGLEPVTPGWLDAMLEHSTDAAIGAVGAKLVDRDGRLRHIGLVMGLRGVAGSPFAGYPGTAEGYISSAVGTRNYSAVSGACLMTRRDVFDSLGGFDARAGVAFAAIDYCLRARRSGLRVVFTPHATFRAATASSTVDDWGSDFMRVEWRDVIHDDPYYNLNLSRDFLDCRPRVLTYT
jgi:hypothetical protein